MNDTSNITTTISATVIDLVTTQMLSSYATTQMLADVLYFDYDDNIVYIEDLVSDDEDITSEPTNIVIE